MTRDILYRHEDEDLIRPALTAELVRFPGQVGPVVRLDRAGEYVGLTLDEWEAINDALQRAGLR